MLQAVHQSNPATQTIPLKTINIHSVIRLFAADVTITQVFRNDEATPIEAVYCFPIEEQAAIYAFVARIDDREIVAELKEKKAAQQDYTRALQQGHGAYLMEQDENSQDNFIINVGALPPSKECTITISYVTELELFQSSIIRFVVPTTIAPRYSPQTSGIASLAGTNAQYVQTSSYTIEFSCQVENSGGSQIARINSSSHPIEIDLSQHDYYTVKFAQQNTHLDRDILINIELAEKRDSFITAIERGAIMAAFIPSEDECRRVTKSENDANEFIFIVDCSGSMDDERKIELARQAVLLFLKSLPMNCYFNIIRFGSHYVTLFNDTTVVYNEENAQKAQKLVKSMKADLGGTELLLPLQWLEQHVPGHGRSRQIFLLTDGEISNVTQVLDLCRSMASSTRIFSFGLGSSPSRSLVKGLARSTNGHFVFIPPNTSVDVHVGEQLQKALQQSITNVIVKWHLGATVVETIPNQLPPVYAKDRLIVYGLVDDKSSSFDHNATVELQVDEQQLSIAKIRQIPNISENGMLARLAAKALILELQHTKLPTQHTAVGSRQTRFQHTIDEKTELTTLELKEIEKKRIIELSLKHKILSPHTAFIGIEKRADGNNDQMILREVPIQISTDDQNLAPAISYNANCSMKLSCRPWRHRSSMASPGFSAYYANAVTSNFNNEDNLCRQNLKMKKSTPLSPSKYYRLKRRSRSRSRSPPSPTLYNIRLTEDSSSEWPTDDQDIIRYLIDRQSFNGLWLLDAESVQHLTGKALTEFQSIHADLSVLMTAIVLVILDTRFSAFSSMWHGVAQKARTIIIEQLDKEPKNLDTLLENIRDVINK